MPAWHLGCYNKDKGTYNQRGFPAKYNGTCASHGCKIFGRAILVGDVITVEKNTSYSNENVWGDWSEEYNSGKNQNMATHTCKKCGTAFTINKVGRPPSYCYDCRYQKDVNSVSYLPGELIKSDYVDSVSVIPENNDNTGLVKYQEPVDFAQWRNNLIDLVLTLIKEREPINNDKVYFELIAKITPKIPNQSKMVEEICNKVLDKIASVTATQITIKDAKTEEVKDLGLQHKTFPILLKTCMARVNAWLAGPSGSGKTTAAFNVAKAMSLPFQYTGAVSDPYALMGFKNANGNYVRTPFREAWEHGGIFLWDEVDASDPNALLAFNAALANGAAPFPDGTIEKHKDCILIAAANTWGHGATHEYVGRLKLDAAFLKRFAFISWDYDEALEMSTAPNKIWTARVQTIRAKVRTKGIRVLVTPRESYIGAQLLEAGIPQNLVEEMTIFSAMTQEQKNQLVSNY